MLVTKHDRVYRRPRFLEQLLQTYLHVAHVSPHHADRPWKSLIFALPRVRNYSRPDLVHNISRARSWSGLAEVLCELKSMDVHDRAT